LRLLGFDEEILITKDEDSCTVNLEFGKTGCSLSNFSLLRDFLVECFFIRFDAARSALL
jgi:hypothetical protein